MYHIFYISIVTRKRKQCYSCFVIAFHYTVIFYSLINVDIEGIDSGPIDTINETYTNRLWDENFFPTNLYVLFLTGTFVIIETRVIDIFQRNPSITILIGTVDDRINSIESIVTCLNSRCECIADPNIICTYCAD